MFFEQIKEIKDINLNTNKKSLISFLKVRPTGPIN
jgi:hypothetical protein